jgi:hypothetical protein
MESAIVLNGKLYDYFRDELCEGMDPSRWRGSDESDFFFFEF